MPLTLAALSFFAVSSSALLVFTFWVASTGRKLRPGEPVPNRRDIRRHLLRGMFYCNPDDPRGWIPKLHGYGWTVNLRDPSWARTVSLLLAGLLLSGMVLIIVSGKG